MTITETKAAQTTKGQGDWDVRGPDFETILVGASIPPIHDADRMVHIDWNNGFPNWALYRTVCAGDTHLSDALFCFCVGFAIAYGQEGGVSRKGISDEVGYAAGRDAYHWLLNREWEFRASEVASALGVAPATYRKLRGGAAARLNESLKEYWVRMQVAIRQVYIVNRQLFAPTPISRYSGGRGFDGEVDLTHDGTFRAMPRGSGC